MDRFELAESFEALKAGVFVNFKVSTDVLDTLECLKGAAAILFNLQVSAHRYDVESGRFVAGELKVALDDDAGFLR